MFINKNKKSKLKKFIKTDNAVSKEAPPEIIELCERPGYIDRKQHADGIRICVELFDADKKQWRTLTSDIGNDVWLLQYPPHSKMAHYCLQGCEFKSPNGNLKFEPAPESDIEPSIKDDDIPF
jgi:hypothetical protein